MILGVNGYDGIELGRNNDVLSQTILDLLLGWHLEFSDRRAVYVTQMKSNVFNRSQYDMLDVKKFLCDPHDQIMWYFG